MVPARSPPRSNSSQVAEAVCSAIAQWVDAAQAKSPGSSGCPGLSAFNRSDGFQLGLDFLRLVRLGVRAIGWRTRPQTLDHRLGLFALLDLRRCPLQEESLLIAHGRPPAMTLLWVP